MTYSIGAIIDTGTTAIQIDPTTYNNLKSAAEKKGITFSKLKPASVGDWTTVTCSENDCSDFPALNFTFKDEKTGKAATVTLESKYFVVPF